MQSAAAEYLDALLWRRPGRRRPGTPRWPSTPFAIRRLTITSSAPARERASHDLRDRRSAEERAEIDEVAHLAEDAAAALLCVRHPASVRNAAGVDPVDDADRALHFEKCASRTRRRARTGG